MEPETDRIKTLEQLRQAIPELAVRGRLSHREPGDGHAAELLAELRSKTGGRGSKSSRRPPEGPPFALPEGWAWAPLEALVAKLQAGLRLQAKEATAGPRLLRFQDIGFRPPDWSTVPFSGLTWDDAEPYLLREGDLLIVSRGSAIGRTYLIADLPAETVFLFHLLRATPQRPMVPRYLKLFADTEEFRRQVDHSACGGLSKALNVRALGAIRVPVPPAAEQQRIADQAARLLTLCDDLEARLVQTVLTGLAEQFPPR